jgi:hypothetical protein
MSERQVAGLEIRHGEKSDHQTDDDAERDFHENLRVILPLPVGEREHIH